MDCADALLMHAHETLLMHTHGTLCIHMARSAEKGRRLRDARSSISGLGRHAWCELLELRPFACILHLKAIKTPQHRQGERGLRHCKL
eukprot:1158293-Pelagomonas_calceolata.AAC.3